VTVHLVGGGPGDPGLLTVRGAELLARAEVVVFDRLAGASLLDLAPGDAELVDVGKQPGRSALAQDDINAVLIDRGRSNRTVVRLTAGDPFVFARGDEEARALRDAGVAFEIVPGVTSAIAAPAYAGIPLTSRYSSTSFTVVRGREDPDTGDTPVNWNAIVRTGGTIVIMMGGRQISATVERLVAAGLAPSTPATAVRWGTRPEQHTTRTTLAGLADAGPEAPSVIVVGEVAAEDLAWFENRPLFGSGIVVTRGGAQTSSLVGRLRELGADPIEVPTIEITDPDDGGVALRAALSDLADYEWLVLTSPNGVRRTLAELHDARALAGVKIAAIGPATAAALEAANIVADLVPERFVAESLLDAMGAPPHDGARVLLSRAAVARDVLPEGLAAAGWSVEIVDAYRTVPVQVAAGARREVASADMVTFTSPSTVTNFVAAFGPDGVPPLVACIGPATAATARELGLDVDIQPEEHTIEGLVAAIAAHASRPSRSGRVM